MLALRHRVREWFRWRRLVRKSPILKRCWPVVKRSPEYRPGPFTVNAEIVTPQQLYQSRAYRENCFDEVRSEIEAGMTSVAVFILGYPVKGHPHDRVDERHYIALPSLRRLGISRSWLRGF